METRRLLLQYKGDRCAACAKTVSEMIERYGTFRRLFEFNHVKPSEKDPNYDNLIRRKLSSKQLDEVDKCVLLCDHCHDIVHAQNIKATLNLSIQLNLDGKMKKAQQALEGQMIVDSKDRKASFLTCERLGIVPYRVSLGSRKPRVYFAQEIETEYLVGWLAKIASIGSITIRSWDKVEVLRVERIGKNDEYRLTMDVRCPFLQVELFQFGPDSPIIWLRNGVGVTKDRLIHGTVTMECDPKLARSEEPQPPRLPKA